MDRQPQEIITLARAIYPTAWGCGGQPYSPKSATQHTLRAVRSLNRAGYQICRNRLGAGHAVPEVAALLSALESIRDADDKQTVKALKAIAAKALKAEVPVDPI